MSNLVLGYNQKKLRRAAMLDRFLGFLFGSFVAKKNYRPILDPRKILVVQSHLIGDAIMATPILKALRKFYPAAQINLLANGFAQDLLSGSPYVDRIITMRFPWSMYDYSLSNLLKVLSVIGKLRKENIDLAIDAQIDMRNAFLMWLIKAKRRLGYDITGGGAFLTDVPEFTKDTVNLLEARLSVLNYLGIDTSDNKIELPVDQSGIDWAELFIKKNNLNKNKIVGIHPGASKKEKLWKPEKFSQVIGFLFSKGCQPVIIEGPEDEYIVNAIISKCKAAPSRLKTNLRNAIAFISYCRLLICLDSAAIHLAGAVNTPVLAIYGPKDPELTKPSNDNIEIIWDESFDCRPCEYGHCKNVDSSCMDAISNGTVIQKIEEIIARSSQIDVAVR